MKKKRVSALVAGSLAVLLVAGMTGCGSNTASVTENDTKTATRAGTTVQTEVAEQSTGKTKITAEEAKAIILADLGVSKADFIELDSERDDNEYEFEVVVGEYEYDYDVNFFTGKIVDKDVDKMDAEDKAEVEAKKAAAETPATEPSKDTTVSKPVVTPSNGTNNKEEVKVPSEKISKEKAKEIALADLGISNAKLVESDYDDGKYEFEFKADGVEYSYEIHAKTGKIVDKDVDRMDAEDKAEAAAKKAATEEKATDKAAVSTPKTDKVVENTSPDKITLEKAKEIALADLGISNAKLVESDYDDGKYEFEFRADGVEYTYEIHAKTGKIVDKDVDRDDWDDDRDDDRYDD